MAWLSGGAKWMTNAVKAFGLLTLLSDFSDAPNNLRIDRSRAGESLMVG